MIPRPSQIVRRPRRRVASRLATSAAAVAVLLIPVVGLAWISEEPGVRPTPQTSPAAASPARTSSQDAFPAEDPARALVDRALAHHRAGRTDVAVDDLKSALRMRPDVVFFLTDADQPKLTFGELQRVRRWNSGTTIHAIEFGAGPQIAADSFLMKLARQNGGQHAYVDVRNLRVEPK